MIVDASAAVDHVLDREPVSSWLRAQFDEVERLRAPHVIDVEVLSAIRRLVLSGALHQDRAIVALADHAALPLVRSSHRRLLPRAWALRANLSASDAFYVALAEVHEEPLVTSDASLARAPGLDVEIRCFE